MVSYLGGLGELTSQLMAVAALLILVSTSLVPFMYCGLSFWKRFDTAALLAVFPLLTVLIPVVMTIVLVGAKWLLLGRLRPGRYHVWGHVYTMRWIIRQITRIMLSLTHWQILNETAAMSWLYRMLGSQIGTNVRMKANPTIDFDALTIGDRSRVSGYLFTSEVCLGMLEVRPVTIGAD